ncbi:MAG TPA: universal stress protein [Candidatus Dormibacteraeota bacterium]|nr:universal stress protein [Candidatus Dormibacteraeota bacterium]
MAIRRILAAIKDPRARRLPGLGKAARLAKGFGAELVLFHALADPLYVGGLDGDFSPLCENPSDIEQAARKAALARLERLASRLRRLGIRVRVSAAWDYPAYEAIVREACRIKAGLIVAEQHPGRHFAAGLLHLNDWELLRSSPMPVLLVKSARAPRRPVVLAAVDPDHTYSKPVRLDRQILGAAAAVAHALRGTLHAAYAYVPLPLTAFSRGVLSDEEVQRLEARTARSAARKLAHVVRGVPIPRARRHVLGRHPVDAIAELAKKTHSAIVVMGAISRSGIKRLLIGNTAERVLDRLVCDILIVKPATLVPAPRRKRRGARYFGIQPRLY